MIIFTNGGLEVYLMRFSKYLMRNIENPQSASHFKYTKRMPKQYKGKILNRDFYILSPKTILYRHLGWPAIYIIYQHLSSYPTITFPRRDFNPTILTQPSPVIYVFQCTACAKLKTKIGLHTTRQTTTTPPHHHHTTTNF